MIKIILPISLFLLSSIAISGELFDEIQIIRDEKQNVILKTNCDLIPKATENLSNLGPVIKNGSLCEVNLNNSLPNQMIQLHDTFSPHSGPNCWNTSLFMAGVLNYRRFVSPEEMDFLTASSICRQRPVNEKPKFGDLIALHTHGDPAEFHGFTYINDLISFSKAGFDKQWDYEIVSSNFVFTTFALGLDIASEKCRHVEGVPSEEECPVYAQYLKCKTYDDYLDQTRFNSKSEFLKFYKDFSQVEKSISLAAVSGDSWDSDKSTEIKNRMDQFKTLAESTLLTILDKSGVDYFFWKSMHLRVDSLLIQIDFLDKQD